MRLAVLVTEFCDLGDLAEVVSKRQKPFSEAFVLQACTNLLMALSTCHSHKVAHRDIKPANILLSSTDVFKVRA